ncbi:MAG: ERF family protein, partial [Ruthenibacterium sp.]
TRPARGATIFSYPSQHKVIESRTFTTKNDYGEKENQFVRVEATYRFVNMEKPEDFVEVTGYGDGVDSLDKAPGKSITYADKYALMKAYKVETGDDTDRTPSDELAGHNIFKIKQRVERTLTEKMQRGMDVKDIYASMEISEKQFKTMMDMYAKLNNFELAVNKA